VGKLTITAFNQCEEDRRLGFCDVAVRGDADAEAADLGDLGDLLVSSGDDGGGAGFSALMGEAGEVGDVFGLSAMICYCWLLLVVVVVVVAVMEDLLKGRATANVEDRPSQTCRRGRERQIYITLHIHIHTSIYLEFRLGGLGDARPPWE
jgi:hypothetical protein